MASEAIAEMEREGRLVVGIAVAVPGLVEVASGTLLRAPNLGWTRLRIVDELKARLPHLDLPIRVENEANLAALAEHWQGAARGVRNFICVFGEVGVGAGIVVDGELYRGAHGFGGEFGHLTLTPGGDLCACGSRGCLETLVGQEAIARRAGLRIESGERTWSLTAELVRRADSGDPAVLAALREAGATLGLGLASVVNLLDLDVVVLGGCFGPLAPWLAVEVEQCAARSRSLRRVVGVRATLVHDRRAGRRSRSCSAHLARAARRPVDGCGEARGGTGGGVMKGEDGAPCVAMCDGPRGAVA